MFGFRKKKTAPKLCPSNPGIGVQAKVAFATGDRSWTEEVNLVRLAAAVLKKQATQSRVRIRGSSMPAAGSR